MKTLDAVLFGGLLCALASLWPWIAHESLADGIRHILPRFPAAATSAMALTMGVRAVIDLAASPRKAKKPHA
jgi:hypothetical protein